VADNTVKITALPFTFLISVRISVVHLMWTIALILQLFFDERLLLIIEIAPLSLIFLANKVLKLLGKINIVLAPL
jgi:hypothetical protein